MNQGVPKEPEEAWLEPPPKHAIPEGPVSVLLKPRKFSWRRSAALLELPDGTRLGVLTTREKGWEHFRIKFAVFIAQIMAFYIHDYTLNNRKELEEALKKPPLSLANIPFAPFSSIFDSPFFSGTTLAASAALSRLLFSRRPSFRFEDARGNLIYTADFKRAQEAWVISAAGGGAAPSFVLRLDRRAREFVLYEDAPQPDEPSGAPELLTPLETASLRIPALLKQGASFAPSDARGFVGKVTSVHRLEIPLGARKIRLPDWRSELYTLEFDGQGEAFAPREVLAFATYIVRTVNTIPVDILLLVGLAAGGVGAVQEIAKTFGGGKKKIQTEEWDDDGDD